MDDGRVHDVCKIQKRLDRIIHKKEVSNNHSCR